MEKLPLSVVVLTKNEEEKIESCLNSVLNWAGEVIVVDDESSDRTREIAEKLDVRVISKKMEIEGKHRNRAYGLAKNIWVLSLDADETVSPELAEELKALFKSDIQHAAFTIPIRTYIGEKWIKHGGWYPAGKVRLFRKDKFRYEEVEVHPRVFIDGTCGHLTKDIIHYSYRDFHDFFISLNSQTTQEAKKWYNLSLEDPKKAAYKMNIPHALWRMMDRFVRTFVFKKGYRDGFLGFMIAYAGSLYQMMSFAKYRELKAADEQKKKRGV